MTTDGVAEEKQASGRLAPLPKRVAPGEEGPPFTGSPISYIVELLERASVLLGTLAHDVAGLAEDKEEESLRAEREREERRKAAAAAEDMLEDYLEKARSIAQNKGKTSVLDRALLPEPPDDPGRSFSLIARELEGELKAARGITGAIRLPRIGELLLEARAAVEIMGLDAEQLKARHLNLAEAEMNAEAKEAEASFEIGSMILHRDLEALEDHLPRAARDWGHPSWQSFEPVGSAEELTRIGTYSNPQLEDGIPFLLELPGGAGMGTRIPPPGLLIEASSSRDEAVRGMQSLLLRLLAALPPGAARLTVIDPKGLGEAAAPMLALTEYDAALLDGGVATTPDEIEAKLTGIAQHIEQVIQRYLRGKYTSLAACNAEAGEVLEPYRFVVIYDHPAQLSERATQLLTTIVENGARAGVHTFVTKDPQPGPSYGGTWGAPQPLGALQTIHADDNGYWVTVQNAGRWRVSLDDPPTQAGSSEGPDGDATRPSIAEAIVGSIGERARADRIMAVGFPKLMSALNIAFRTGQREGLPAYDGAIDAENPDTWWTASATRSIGAPLGRGGTAGPYMLLLDDHHACAAVAGRHGSGLSNLLVSAIAAWAVLYPPEEIELHLLALRGSDTFAPFAEHDLPHAKLVAIEADREFGLSELESLVQAIEQRREIFRQTTGERAGYGGYRQGGNAMPRIVLVLEQFGELFTERDRIAERSADLLDKLLRLGPAVGIHTVLATPADPGALRAKALTHARIRIALPIDQAGAEQLLADQAFEATDSATPGDVVAVSMGEADSARRFRTALVSAHELDIIARDLRRLADQRGLDTGPRVVNGAAVARLEGRDVAQLVGDAEMQHARMMPRLWLGEPLALGDPVEALLRRQDSANLLVLTEDSEVGQGILLSAITTASLVHGTNLATMILDFMPMEAGFSEAAQLLGTGPWTIQLARRRSLPKVLDVIHRVVQDRLTTSDYKGKPVLFVLNGLGRARDLEVGPNGESHPDDLEASRLIDTIVHDGPEVGVHTLAWCDNLSTLNRRLPKSAVREFALRVAGPMAPDEGAAFIDSELVGKLEPNQAVLYDEDWGRLTRFRPYVIPSIDWLQRLVDDMKPSIKDAGQATRR